MRTGPVSSAPSPTARRGERGRYAGLNLAAHVGDAPDAVAENRAPARERLGRARRLHGPGATAPRSPSSTACRDRCPPSATRWSPARRGARSRCWSPTACPVLLADDRWAWSASVHAGRRGVRGGRRPRTVEAMRALGRRAGGCRRAARRSAPLLRGSGRDARRSRRGAPAVATVSRTGTPALDLAAGVVAQLGDGAASAVARVPALHAGARRPLLLPARRGDRAVRRGRGPGCGDERRRTSAARRRRDELADRLAQVHARIARGVRGGRAPRRGDPRRRHEDLPGQRRRAARRPRRHRDRREPRPGGGGEGRRAAPTRDRALALRRSAADATRRARSRATPTSCTRSTAARSSTPSTAARGRPAARSTSPCRSPSTHGPGPRAAWPPGQARRARRAWLAGSPSS